MRGESLDRALKDAENFSRLRVVESGDGFGGFAQRDSRLCVTRLRPRREVGVARDVVEAFALILIEIAKDGAPGEGVDERRDVARSRAASGDAQEKVNREMEGLTVMLIELALAAVQGAAMSAAVVDTSHDVVLGALEQVVNLLDARPPETT